jgi:hypothetical protein
MRIREPSTKSKCEIDGVFLHTLIPLVPPTSSSCNKRLERPSAHKKEKIWREGISLTETPSSFTSTFIDGSHTLIDHQNIVHNKMPQNKSTFHGEITFGRTPFNHAVNILEIIL